MRERAREGEGKEIKIGILGKKNGRQEEVERGERINESKIPPLSKLR